jgi:hypothetical protein
MSSELRYNPLGPKPMIADVQVMKVAVEADPCSKEGQCLHVTNFWKSSSLTGKDFWFVAFSPAMVGNQRWMVMMVEIFSI